MSTGQSARRKGLTGERDVAQRFRDAGWMVRGLEGSGDWLALRNPRETRLVSSVDALHVECKRQERIRITEWMAQAADEAPPGVPPLVIFRRNREQWMVCLPLADYLEQT